MSRMSDRYGPNSTWISIWMLGAPDSAPQILDFEGYTIGYWMGMATYSVFNVPFIVASSSLIAVSGSGVWAVRLWGRLVSAPSRLAAILNS